MARAERYVAMEAGAAAQNLLLQVAKLGLGGALVGAFDEAALRCGLSLGDSEKPLANAPVMNQAAQGTPQGHSRNDHDLL